MKSGVYITSRISSKNTVNGFCKGFPSFKAITCDYGHECGLIRVYGYSLFNLIVWVFPSASLFILVTFFVMLVMRVDSAKQF